MPEDSVRFPVGKYAVTWRLVVPQRGKVVHSEVE
jgi:hypothetical protein